MSFNPNPVTPDEYKQAMADWHTDTQRIMAMTDPYESTTTVRRAGDGTMVLLPRPPRDPDALPADWPAK